MKRAVLLCLILTTGSCATYIDVPIGVPPRPHLMPLTAEMQARIPVDALDIIAVNQAVLKNWGRGLENRILIHDESL